MESSMPSIAVATLGLLLLIVSGCESGQAARNMARISLGTTVSYEQEVDAKIAAENQYYQQSVVNLEKSTKKQAGLSEQVDIDSLALSYQAQFADKANPVTESDLRSFGEAIINQVQLGRNSFAVQLAQYKDQTFFALGQLNYQKDALKKVRKGLEELQAELSQTEMAKVWYDFIKETKAKYDESKKDEKK
jgi:hypothetical protein